MNLSTLQDWLDRIGCVHSKEIDLGLDRVKLVAERLGLLKPDYPVIIVGGTNGKGSTVATLESIYQAAGYHVGVFTSPILFKHNEYVRMDGQTASDQAFCEAYERITEKRGEVTLTPFEFHTLAALWLFKRCFDSLVEDSRKKVIILEVGMGGRLDAVNILDADVAVVTSIDIDHIECLGKNREAIGFEKAGIFRSAKPAVLGDINPPVSILNYAKQIGSQLYRYGEDFKSQTTSDLSHPSQHGRQIKSRKAEPKEPLPENWPGRLKGQALATKEIEKEWQWSFQGCTYKDLPVNSLAIQNLSCALMAIHLLQEKLPVNQAEIKQGLLTVTLAGRKQVIPGEITEIYDVAHNPAAVSLLAADLKKMPHTGKRIAVFSMLGDKDIVRSIIAIKNQIDYWYVAPLREKRAATEIELIKAFQKANVMNIEVLATMADAYQAAKKNTKKNDVIIIFGSFKVIAELGENKL